MPLRQSTIWVLRLESLMPAVHGLSRYSLNTLLMRWSGNVSTITDSQSITGPLLGEELLLRLSSMRQGRKLGYSGLCGSMGLTLVVTFLKEELITGRVQLFWMGT
jgi:hypothetical protein